MTVYQVLGRDYVEGALLGGKSKDDIRKEARSAISPIKESLGDDVFEAFKSQGVPFSRMKEYADFQVQKAEDAAKAAEEKAYEKEVKGFAKSFEEDLKGEDFTDRLNRGAHRVVSELAVAGNNLVGSKPDPRFVGVLEADDKLSGEFEEKRRTPEEQKIYEEKEKAFADANGTVDTLTTGADMLYQKVKNPSEWNMAGLLAEGINPINWVGGAAGNVAAKALANTAVKSGTAVAVGTGAGAVTDGAVGYGFDYSVERGRGRTEEEATKAATLGAAANVAMGGVTGAGGVLYGRWNNADTPGPNPQTSDATLVVNEVEIPDDIKNSTLLKVAEAEDHSTQADTVITELSSQVTDTQARDALIAKYIPATQAEAELSMTINNDVPVHDRLTGARVRTALEKTMIQATDTPESLNAKLAYYGFTDESRAMIVDAYVKNDIEIFDNFVADKLERRAKGEYDARIIAGNEREDTRVQTDRVDSSDAGARETVDPNAEPETISEFKPRDTEDLTTTGRDIRNLDEETGVPITDKTVDGQPTVGDDGRVVPRTGGDQLVQNENGVPVDVETPTQIYDRLKDEAAISGEEKARLRLLSEDYDVEQSSVSDGVISRYDNGFELRSYPLRVKKIDELVESPNGKKIINTLSYVDDEALSSALDFQNNVAIKRVVNNSDIKHIFKQHGDSEIEASRGQIAIDKNDIANYPDIVIEADMQGIVTGKNNVKKVLSAKQINGHYIVVEEVSTKKNTLSLKTMWKVQGKLKADTLRSIGGESPTLIVRNALGYEPNELMPSPRKAPVIKSIADDMKNVKTRGELKSHRYYDDVKNIALGKKNKDGFHTYSTTERKNIQSGKLDRPLLQKLRDDLREYAANPKWEKNRAEIDTKVRSEADVLREISHDDALGLVQSETFTKTYKNPLSVDDMVRSIDDRLDNVNKKVETNTALDSFFGDSENVKLSDTQNKVLSMIDDPIKRETKKKKFELSTLESKVKEAELKAHKGTVTRTKNELKTWKAENMRDGKIKEIGDC